MNSILVCGTLWGLIAYLKFSGQAKGFFLLCIVILLYPVEMRYLKLECFILPEMIGALIFWLICVYLYICRQMLLE